MLECLSPLEFAELRVARPTIPLEDGWLQAGVICASNHNEWAGYRAGKAGRRIVPQNWLREGKDFIPRVRPKKLEHITVNQASISAYQAITEANFKRLSR
jgi:hypothetical protein